MTCRTRSSRAATGTRATWRRWGPYLSERAWGTVREDYSRRRRRRGRPSRTTTPARAPTAGARTAWAGICDERQRLCLAFAFWNGRDPILKERIFGLTGHEGNHGEDAKEYWWYLDSTPTHSWMRWRYVYPQAAVPYEDLRAREPRRGREDAPEYELLDTGAFDDDRYWDIDGRLREGRRPTTSASASASATPGPSAATLHVLPTLWFRNRWSWDAVDAPRRVIRAGRAASWRRTPRLGTMTLARGRRARAAVLRQRDEQPRGSGRRAGPPYPKDGINDHVVTGAPTVNPAAHGDQGGALVPAGGRRPGRRAEVRLRLAPRAPRDLGAGWTRTMTRPRARGRRLLRRRSRPAATEDEALRDAPGVRRDALEQAVLPLRRRPLAATATRPSRRRRPSALRGPQRGWRHIDNHDVISMPDKWEYPWFAAWDLAFHCVALAHVDPAFAKEQLRLITREWYMHPNGQLPAYEWDFGDVNPPVHALAALARVPDRRRRATASGSQRIFHKLLLGFTWWANAKDPEGDNLFGGGFLGMDNIGPFDRSSPLPDGPRAGAGRRDRLDGLLLPGHARDRARAGRPTTRPTRTWR